MEIIFNFKKVNNLENRKFQTFWYLKFFAISIHHQVLITIQEAFVVKTNIVIKELNIREKRFEHDINI